MTFEAVLLIGFVLVVTGAIKNAAPTLPSWLTPFVAMAIGVLCTFVVAETDTEFSSRQLINGVALDTLNAWTKIVIGIMIGAGGSLTAVLGKVVSNIGSNQLTTDRTITNNAVDRHSAV